MLCRHDRAERALLILCLYQPFLATFIKRAESFLFRAIHMADYSIFVIFGAALVIVGVMVIAAVVIRASMGTKKEGKVHGAGVIMIGPVPIIFGTDKKSVKSVLALALALTVALLIFLVLYYWLLR